MGCLVVSVGVCWCLLVCCVPWRCHGVVWGVSEGYLSGIHRNWRRSDVFGGYVGSQSLQYGAKTLFRHSPERHNFCRLTILRHSNIKMVAYKLSKNGWVMPFLWFLGLSEKNYSSQLLWITLYQELTIEQQTIGAWQLLDNYRWAWLPWEWAVKPPQNLPRGTTQGSPWKAAPRVATRDQTALARLTHDKHTHKQGDIFLCAYFRVFWQDSSKYVFSRCAVCMFSHGWIISKDVQCVF